MTAKTAMERIKEIEQQPCCFSCSCNEIKLLLKAFRVMREIAIEKYQMSSNGIVTDWTQVTKSITEYVDCRLEERMNK